MTSDDRQAPLPEDDSTVPETGATTPIAEAPSESDESDPGQASAALAESGATEPSATDQPDPETSDVPTTGDADADAGSSETADTATSDDVAADAADDTADLGAAAAPHGFRRFIPRLPSKYGAPLQLTTIERLRDFHPTDRLNGWLVTIGITALAFVTRIINLGTPNKLLFDETYYPKDAYSILKYGYERNWPDTANNSIIAGMPDVTLNQPEFAVHPPLGKLLIAVGEHFFGMNTFGWRIMPAIFGTILIFVTIRLARRLSRSTLVGGIAGLLLTLDGLAFVMSRLGLLDIFQSAFIVIGASCVVADRDYFRAKLANYLEKHGLRELGGSFGPLIGWRPWRLAAGIAFGAACAVKWNSMYALAVFGILSVLWDVGARRLAGAQMKSWWALVADGIPAFLYMVVVAFGTYLASWTRWLQTSGGWDRDWGQHNPDSPLVKYFGEALASLIKYHQEIYAFHTGDYINSATHPYSAHPAFWLIMARPTGVEAVNDIPPGMSGCEGPGNCIQIISAAGTPILWWMAAAALVVSLIWWLAARDWRFSVPVLGALCTYLPWFAYTSRPLFFFYAITIIPFTCIGLAMVMGLILGDPERTPRRRKGATIVGVAVALVALNFSFIYPILTAQTMPYTSWLARMWFGSWV